ncbi:MAG: outer membrane beta-barrel protein [Bacteroidota bacterium]
MKKYYFLVLLTIGCVQLQAQGELGFGFKAGLNFSTMDGALETDAQGNELESVEYSTGFSVGALLNYSITDIFGLRGEFIYSQKGRTINFDGPSYFIFDATGDRIVALGDRSVSADVLNSYLEIPILGYAKFGKIEIMGGAYVAGLINSVADGTMRFSPSSQAGTNFTELPFTLDYRYQRDNPGEGRGEVTPYSINGIGIDVPSTLGAYYEYSMVEKNLYNFLDFGLIGGLSFYLSDGFFVNARLEYGLTDTTDDDKDVAYAGLANNQFIFRDDINRNFAIHTSVAFRF